MSEEEISAVGAREPSDADRPPVSRVGDELQQRADREATDEVDAREAERVEDDAFAEARRKGWDKDLSGDE